MLIGRVKELNVIVETILPYLKKQVTKEKILHFIPGGVFENDAQFVPVSLPLKIVIPGTVESGRRDYSQAFELLALAEKAGVHMEIVLAGKPMGKYGDDILMSTKQWQGECTKISGYHETLSQPEFDKQLRSAHFIFLPTMINSISPGGVKEIYGITKSTGNLYDIIRHAKPAFLPAPLIIPGIVEASCLRYERLTEILERLMNFQKSPGEYDEICRKALNTSRQYTVESIRKQNPGLYQGM